MPKLGRSVLLGGVALAFCAGTTGLYAASDQRNGDGSGVTDPDLLRGSYDAEWEEAGATPDPIAPFFTTEWSLALRGAYVKGTAGERIDTIIAPAFTMSHDGQRSNLLFEGDAEIIKPSNDAGRLSALRLSGAVDYALDRSTTLSGEAGLEVTQGASSDLGQEDNVAIASRVIDGTLAGEVVREQGRFILTTSGEVGRTWNGPTTLDGGVTEDNTSSNVTSLGGSFRLGFELSPRLILFTEAGREYQYFDAASPALNYKLDGTTDVLRGGLTAEWGRFITAEASIGTGIRRYKVTGLPEVSSMLYRGSLTYAPDETFSLVAAFDTKLGAPTSESAGTARVEYSASLEAKYIVNSWLGLRASAGWDFASTVGTPDTEESHTFGVGADYLVNSHATLTADYDFERGTYSPDPTEDVHRFMLGLVLSN